MKYTGLYRTFRTVIAGVFFMVFSQVVSAQNSGLTAVAPTDSLYRQALHFLEQQNLNAALVLLDQAVKNDKDNPAYWELLLGIHQEMNNLPKASEALSELIRIRPDERQYYLDQGFLLAYQEEFDQALEVYDRLGERLGKDEQVYTARARVFQMMNRTDDALRELEEVIDKGEGQLIAYVMLSELYAEQDRYAKALDIIAEGRSKFGEQPLLNLTHAEVLRASGQVDEAYVSLLRAFDSHMFDLDYKAGALYRAAGAVPAYKEEHILALADLLVRQYPVSVKSLAVRADIYSQYGRYEEAKAAYVAALEVDPLVPVIWQQLIGLANFMGQTEDMKQYAEHAVSHFPGDPDLLFFAGHAELLSGNTEAARSYMEAALNNTVNQESQFEVQIYSTLGGIYNDLEMYSASDVAYEEALARDSMDVYTLNNYAYYLAVRNDKLERALQMSTLAVELQPDFGTFEDTHAWVLFRLDRQEEALKWIVKAIRNSEEPSSVLFEHYGDILFVNGKVRDAVAQWKKARKNATSADGSIERLDLKVRTRSLVE